MKKNLARREKKRKKRNVRTDEDVVTGRENGKMGKGERRTSILVESLYNDSRQALVGLEIACSTGGVVDSWIPGATASADSLSTRHKRVYYG